jgi:hypothetical protein
MPIFYTLVARDGHILTEATSRTVEAGNFQQIALQILSKIGQESEGAKRSFSTGGCVPPIPQSIAVARPINLCSSTNNNINVPPPPCSPPPSACSYVFNIQINDGVVYLCLVDLSMHAHAPSSLFSFRALCFLQC